MKIFQWLSLVVFLLSTAINGQAYTYSQQSKALLDQQTEDIRKTVEVIAEHEAALGNDIGDLSYTVSLPSQSISDLGLVLNFSKAENGFKVLSVVPGSTADKLSIKHSDYIVKVNDKSINNSNKDTLKGLFQHPENIIKIAFVSAGVYQEKNILVKYLYLPEVNLMMGENSFSPESLKRLEQLKQRIQGTLLTITEEETNLGNSMHQFSYLADIPKQTLANLGLVFNLDSNSGGYRVVDIPAGSSAESLSLEKGDLIISINHMYILQAAHNNLIDELHNLSAGQEVTLGVLVGETEHFLTTKIKAKHIPAINFTVGDTDNYSLFKYQLPSTYLTKILQKDRVNKDENSCGVVSLFKAYGNSSSSEHKDGMMLIGSKIRSVGGNGGKQGITSFTLPVGKHTFEVKTHFRKTKSIEINVKANKKYNLASFTLPNKETSRDRLSSTAIRVKGHKKFWLPIVWKETDYTCNL